MSDSPNTFQMYTTPNLKSMHDEKYQRKIEELKKMNLIPFGGVSTESFSTETLKTHYGWNLILPRCIFFSRVVLSVLDVFVKVHKVFYSNQIRLPNRHVHLTWAWAWVWPCDVLK